MIELVFVIVVIGIITAVMLPRLDRDNVYEAAQQVVSHIKYTQHLAMIDNKFDDTDPVWFEKMWRITFRANSCYAIFSDQDGGGVASRAESARDPLATNKTLYSNTTCTDSDLDNDILLLANNYNIDTIDLAGPCFPVGNRYIAFDNLGRPHIDVSNSVNVSTAACTITLKSGTDNNATITIEPETGYTYLSSITP